MVSIKHRVGIKENVQKVYQALATTEGISKWWTKDTTGDTSLGGTIITKFHSPDGAEVGSMKIEVMGMTPEKYIRWKFLDGPREWIGTELVFELVEEKEFTIVLFRHLDWAEEVEFMAHCSMKWAVFLLSLKQYLEDGKGNPAPNDIKIDNWN